MDICQIKRSLVEPEVLQPGPSGHQWEDMCQRMALSTFFLQSTAANGPLHFCSIVPVTIAQQHWNSLSIAYEI